jgi:hypothetical protein
MSELPRLFEPDTDPLACQHVGQRDGQHNWCSRGEFWTSCTVGHFGEKPRCALDPPDNSPQACARRVAWFKEHK